MPVTVPFEIVAVAVALPELNETVGAVTYPDPPLVTLTAPTQVVHGSEAPVVLPLVYVKPEGRESTIDTPVAEPPESGF